MLKMITLNPIKIIVRLSVLVFFIFIISDLIFPFDFPNNKSNFSQVIVDRNGQLLRAFADKSGVWRQMTSTEKVSNNYIDALINYEDRWFNYHYGFNPVSLVRAAWDNYRCGCVVSGGSTITMQVARRFHPHKRTILGKLKQLYRAIQLEWHLSKDEILDLYLNFAPFGGTLEGVEAASQAYLEKSAEQLTKSEAALLSVLPQAPSRLRPDRYSGLAKKARNKVLDRMLAFGVWSEDDVKRAKEEIISARKPKRPQVAPILSRELRKKYPDKTKVVTSIDYDLQYGIEQEIKNWIVGQPKHSSAAILVVENSSLDVLAYIGSADFSDHSRYGHVDMVTAIRSPGSTLKPFIYGLAIEEGIIHSHSLLSDAPRAFQNYRPENFSRGFSGPVSTQEALHRSLNIPAVQVLNKLGPKKFFTKMRSTGVDLKLPADTKANLAIALGGIGVSLESLVMAYASISNGGQVGQLNTEREEWIEPSKNKRYLMNSSVAWVVYKMLASNPRPDRALNEGIVSADNTLAWKTGTSYGYRDAWAIGTNKTFTVGIWLGRPDGSPLPGHYGALNAAPLLFRIVDNINKENPKYVRKPDNVVESSICWPLGKKKIETEDKHCHLKKSAWLVDGASPLTINEEENDIWSKNPLPIWVDQKTKMRLDIGCQQKSIEKNELALWPKRVEPWLAYKYTLRGQLPKISESCELAPLLEVRSIKILGLKENSIYRTPRLQGELPEISLKAMGGLGKRSWFVNGRFIAVAGEAQSIPYKFTTLGENQFVVIDEQGSLDKVNVIVERGI